MKQRLLPAWTVWVSLAVGSMGIFACGKGESAAGGGEPEVTAQELPADTPGLYQAVCAPCHGVEGDGNGVVKLDRPARSFKAGAFSFGNTPEALLRTITNGIGGTPMPGFKATLTEEQRVALAAYVIELGPERDVILPGASVMTVTDRPLVVRGSLPPIAERLAPVPRGLLVGGVDGLTFEYNAKPLVLLGVRQGGFVDRKDWEGRGGSELMPLGQLSHLVEGGNATHMWVDSVSNPLDARLIATEVQGGAAWVQYELSLAGGQTVMVREQGSAVTVAGWPGFRRTFLIAGFDNLDDLQLAILEKRKVAGVARGPEGLLMRRNPEDELPVFYWMHKPTKVGAAGGEENFILWNVYTQFEVDTLYGLKPTEENLAGLKELVQ
ncbi:MAG: cytochrome c [Planctomycetes bacterium]|nr:cytochrome c [Planctomycetota bacterium]